MTAPAVHQVDVPPAAPGWAILLLILFVVLFSSGAWFLFMARRKNDEQSMREWEQVRRDLEPRRRDQWR